MFTTPSQKKTSLTQGSLANNPWIVPTFTSLVLFQEIAIPLGYVIAPQLEGADSGANAPGRKIGENALDRFQNADPLRPIIVISGPSNGRLMPTLFMYSCVLLKFKEQNKVFRPPKICQIGMVCYGSNKSRHL